MTRKPLVLFPVGYRSDEVLTIPIRRRIRDNDRVDMVKVHLCHGSFYDGYTKINKVISQHTFDFAVINADRIEMAGAAAACFHAGIPFAHLYAGTLNNIGTLDDVNRHVMTLQSTMQFCESEIASERVFDLRSSVKLPVNQIHTVGITHLDDITLANACWPDEPYDLVAWNPPGTHLPEQQQWQIISDELEFITGIAGQDGRKVLAIMPSPDRGDKYIISRLNGISRGMDWVLIKSLPRSQFLSVLKHCDRFITNSSSEYYEAPVLRLPSQKTIHIGMRNANRDTGPFATGASDRIVKIIEEYLCNQKAGNENGENQRSSTM